MDAKQSDRVVKSTQEHRLITIMWRSSLNNIVTEQIMSYTPRIEYHLKELKIARNSNSEHHIMPALDGSKMATLTVGCGIGQTLVELDQGK